MFNLFPLKNKYADTNLRTFTEGGISWTVNEQGGQQVGQWLLRQIETLCKEPSLSTTGQTKVQLVKQNVYRATYRIHLDGAREGIYVKKYDIKDWRVRLLSRFLLTQAQREWKMMLEFREMGLPVPLPIALGQKSEGQEITEYLLTQEVSAAQPVRDSTQWNKEVLLKALAVLTLQLHRNHIFMRDFQLGNILLRAEGPRPQLCLLDLHSASFVKRLKKPQKIWMLAKLLDSFTPLFDFKDEERFLELYARGMPDFHNEFRVNVEKVQALARKIKRTHLKSRTYRCLRNSTSFALEEHSGWRVYRKREFSTEEVFKILKAYEDSSQENNTEIKNTNKTHLRILESENGSFCVKHYRCNESLDYLKRLVGISRARRAWVIGNGLVVRGIPTAQPLALVECQEEAFLLSRALTNFPRLDHYVLENFRENLNYNTLQKKKRFITALAQAIKILHDKKVYHGDLKACNILVEELPQGSNPSFTGLRRNADPELIPLSPPLAKGDLGGFEAWQFYLIDYDRVMFDREISLRRRAKNLAQLHTSIPWCIGRTDRMRFYREYSKGLELDKKSFIGKVLQFSASRIPVLMEPIE